MLTGTRAFHGEDVSDTLAAVLAGTPDWTRLSPDLPPGIRTLVTGCLARDRQKRIGDVSVALFLLREPATVPVADNAAQPAVTPKQKVAPGPEVRLRRGTFMICLAIAFGILAYLSPRSIFFPASIILGAIGAGNLIYYFIAKRRSAHPPERS
jgi:hypothetical protein